MSRNEKGIQSVMLRRVLWAESIVNFITCSFLNFICALVLRWGRPLTITVRYLMGDVGLTCCITCALVLLFAVPAAGRYRRAGMKISGLRVEKPLQRLPASPALLYLVLIAAAFAVLTPVFWLGLQLLRITWIPAFLYALCKGLWGGALGSISACTAVCRFLLPAKTAEGSAK